jgi:ribosomal protein S18 acetylase RimI-like enzyme
MNQPLIRTMREDDLDFAAGCTAAERRLTETREEFEGFLDYDRQGCFIAEWEGRRAGICMAICYGDKGYIGEMIVDREFRPKGDLTDAVVKPSQTIYAAPFPAS